MDDVLDRVRSKRLVFTVTTGRSGTAYLARVLGLFRDVDARHEPRPTFGRALRTICAEPSTAGEFWRDEKLPRIARSRAPIYAETSHVACEGFFEALAELGLAPTLIHLVRARREVALSLASLRAIPGRTYAGVRHFLAPWDERVAIPIERSRGEALADYQLCYWHTLEIERRARRYAQLFAPLGARVERVELAELATPESIRALGRRLDLGPLSPLGRVRLRAVAGRRVNLKVHRKRPVPHDERELDALEREVDELARDAAALAR